MSVPQKKFREVLFQLLYSLDLDHSKENQDQVLSLVMKEQKVTKKVAYQAMDRALSIYQKREELDDLVENMSEEYALDRVQVIERNILRLGLFEMLIEDLPPQVAISESIRLVRKFGTAAGGKFINAIMDQIRKDKGL